MPKIKGYWFLFFILVILIILNFSHRLYFNIFTHSLPSGIYLRINGVPERNDYAATCLTTNIARYGIARGYLEQGICSSGSVLVLKIIRGMPGDNFEVKDGVFKINGQSYPLMALDSRGRDLKVFYSKTGRVAQGKYILLSGYVKNSWDSRYFGPVTVQFLLKPLWTLGQYIDMHVHV